MILFAFETYAATAAALQSAMGQLQLGRFQVARFENGELHLEVETRGTAEH